MKISPKNKLKHQKIKKKGVEKPKKEHVLVVAQEIKFARLLASNEKKIRDRALKSLKKWLLNCFDRGYEFKENDFLRIWKGLFYAVWMSDKPLVQEELCENISGILDVFPPQRYKDALLLVKVGFQTLAAEWYGIDHHRMDKCLMLVRRYLRGSLRCVARSNWSELSCDLYSQMLAGSDGILALKTPLYAKNATSMILHIIDCYLEELSKVSKASISGETVARLLSPFCSYLCLGDNDTVAASCRRLLTELLRQSDVGLTYQDKTRAWEKMGCPEGGPDALELASDEESISDDEGNPGEQLDDSTERLDPRAGKAHVTLTPLPVAATQIAAMLGQCRAKATPTAVRRARITIRRFEALAKNEYPLKVQPMDLESGPPLPSAKKAAKTLQALEKKLITSTDELALRGLSRKHRKRLLAKSRAGVSIVEDSTLSRAVNSNAQAGDFEVEDTQPAKKIKRQGIQHGDNKENVKKKNKKPALDVKHEKNIGKNKAEQPKNLTEPKTKNLKKKKLEIQNEATESPKSILKISQKNAKKIKTDIKPVMTKKVVTHEKTLQKKEPLFQKPENLTQKTKPAKNLVKTLKNKTVEPKLAKNPTIVAKKVKKYQKQLTLKIDKNSVHEPKKVQFVLKNNSKQDTIDYYKSVRQSPKIPFDSSRRPSKTNLKVSTPSPINPFFKKKWKINA